MFTFLRSRRRHWAELQRQIDELEIIIPDADDAVHGLSCHSSLSSTHNFLRNKTRLYTPSATLATVATVGTVYRL